MRKVYIIYILNTYESIFQQKILVCHVFVSLCDICKFWTLVCESCDIFGGYSQLEHLKGQSL